jgi:hypothetical protein
MPKKKKQTIQDLYLELIRRTQFNEFDGKRVADDLEENRSLWISVVMDSAGFSIRPFKSSICLIKLRDMHMNVNNVDTIFLLVKKENKAKVRRMVSKWFADEVSWMDRETVTMSLGGGYGGEEVLRVWWD